MDEYFGTLLSSDADFFPLQNRTILLATQTTHIVLKSPENFSTNSTPSLPYTTSKPSTIPQTPVTLVSLFPHPPALVFSYASSRLPATQISIGSPFQILQPQMSKNTPQIILKTTRIKPSLTFYNNYPTIFFVRPCLSNIPFSSITDLTQQIFVSSSSNLPRPITMNLPSQHWTSPSTNTSLSSVITQPPTLIPSTSRVPSPQRSSHLYTIIIPTCGLFSTQLQTFEDRDYRYHAQNLMNGINAHTIYQFGSEPPNSKQQRMWNFRKTSCYFSQGPRFVLA